MSYAIPQTPEKEHNMFGDDNNWLIWIIILFLIFGNNSGGCGCDNGCNNGCSNGCNSGCGGTDIILLIILLLIFSGSDGCLGNLFGSCSKD